MCWRSELIAANFLWFSLSSAIGDIPINLPGDQVSWKRSMVGTMPSSSLSDPSCSQTAPRSHIVGMFHVRVWLVWHPRGASKEPPRVGTPTGCWFQFFCHPFGTLLQGNGDPIIVLDQKKVQSHGAFRFSSASSLCDGMKGSICTCVG